MPIRSIMLVLLILNIGTATAQSSNDLPEAKEVLRRDSFLFCSRLYPITNDSHNKGCSYLSTPEQVGCNNGAALFWHYFKSRDIAHMNVEDLVKQRRKAMKTFSAQQVKCSLRVEQCTDQPERSDV